MAKRQTILSQGSYGASTSTRQANVVPGSMGDASGLINVGNAISQTGANVTKFAKQKRDQLDKEITTKAEMMVRAGANQTEVEWESIKETLKPGEQMAAFTEINDKHYAALQDSLKELATEDPTRAEKLFGEDIVKNAWTEATSRQWKEAGILDVTTKRADYIVTKTANARDSIEASNTNPAGVIEEAQAKALVDVADMGTKEREEYLKGVGVALYQELDFQENRNPGSITDADISATKLLLTQAQRNRLESTRLVSSKRRADGLAKDVNVMVNDFIFSGTSKMSDDDFELRMEIVRGDPSLTKPEKTVLESDARMARDFGRLFDKTNSTAYLQDIGGVAQLTSIISTLNTEEDFIALMDSQGGGSYFYSQLPSGKRKQYLDLYKGRLREYAKRANSFEWNDLYYADENNRKSMEGFSGIELVNRLTGIAEEMGVDPNKIAAVTPEQEKGYTDLVAAGMEGISELSNQVTLDLQTVESAMVLREVARAISSDDEQPDDIAGAFSVLSALIHNNNNVPLEPLSNMLFTFALLGDKGEHFMETNPSMMKYGPADYSVIRAMTGAVPARSGQINTTLTKIKEDGIDGLSFAGTQTIANLVDTFDDPKKVMQWVDRAAAAHNYQVNATSPAQGYAEVYKILASSIVTAPMGGLNSKTTPQHRLPNFLAQQDSSYWFKVAEGTAADANQVATWLQGSSDAFFLHLPMNRGIIGNVSNAIDAMQPDIFTPGDTEFDLTPHLSSRMFSKYVQLPEIWRSYDFGNLRVDGRVDLSGGIMDLTTLPEEEQEYFNSHVGADPWSRAVAIIQQHGSMIYNSRTETMDLYVRSGLASAGVEDFAGPAGGFLRVTEESFNEEGESYQKPVSVPISDYIDYINRYNEDQSEFQRLTQVNVFGAPISAAFKYFSAPGILLNEKYPDNQVDNSFYKKPDKFDPPPQGLSPLLRKLGEPMNTVEKVRMQGGL